MQNGMITYETKFGGNKMRKQQALKLLKWLCTWLVFAGLMYLFIYKTGLDNQTKTVILQAIESNSTATVEIHSSLIPMDFIEKVVQEHNQKAKEGDIYSIYPMTEKSCWISSPNAYKKSAAEFRGTMVESSVAIEEGKIPRAEIPFTYATEEQEKEFQDSIEFWEEFIKERADMKITAECYVKGGGIVTKITVILTAKNFEVEGGQWPPSTLGLATCKNIC